MTGTEVFLLVLIILLATWNFIQQLTISDVDFRIDNVEMTQNRQESHIKLNEETAHAVNGDVKLLAERLGLYFDTIPETDSKRVLRLRENDEIAPQQLDVNFEIDDQED